MKIEYRTPAGLGPYTVLLDETTDPLQGRVKGFTPKLRKRPQIEPRFGSNKTFIADRGNGVWEIPWTIERVHANPDAAHAFLAVHIQAMNVQALFDFRITVGAVIVYALNAALESIEPLQASDMSSTLSYQWTAEDYTTIV